MILFQVFLILQSPHQTILFQKFHRANFEPFHLPFLLRRLQRLPAAGAAPLCALRARVGRGDLRGGQRPDDQLLRQGGLRPPALRLQYSMGSVKRKDPQSTVNQREGEAHRAPQRQRSRSPPRSP